MKKIVGVFCFCLFACHTLQAQVNNSSHDSVFMVPVDQKRVAEIAAMLDDVPKGYGVPIEDRVAWNNLMKSGKCRPIVVAADKFISEPFPKMTEEIYMSFFKGKDSETSKSLTTTRRAILGTVVWAECLTNKGKYLPFIEAALDDLLRTKSWNFPAEDRQLTNYKGTLYTINLSSADYGSQVAQTLYLLGDKIKPEMRKRTMEVLYQKVFNPTVSAIKNGNKYKEFRSLLDDGNHNSVTLSGVVNAALSVIEDKQERAFYIAVAEHYSKNALLGFTADGYCTEGIAYYNYGMGFHVLLRESIYQATQGKVDIFKDPKMKKIGTFIPRMEIINGVYPAIGDCSAIPVPNIPLVFYMNKTFDLGLKEFDSMKAPAKQPLTNLMYHFPNSTSAVKSSAHEQSEGIRSYFDFAGVLTVRPAAGSKFNMGATFKGGHNNENHNHNDVGSFSIALGNEMIMGDVGLATYTPKTFSTERYTAFKTIASYGHDVPLLAGVQQHEGADAKAIISKTDFTPLTDQMTMDISSAYKVKGLKKMVRHFLYNRSEDGYLEVRDEFEFVSPEIFETALTTRGKWTQPDANTIEITGSNGVLLVNLNAPGKFKITAEKITETPVPYTRLGIRLTDPSLRGTFKITFKPKK